MLTTFAKRLGWFLLLVIIQALILNNVSFFGYATPFLYVYLLLKFDANISRYSLLLWGFFLGLAVDIFSNTPGVNAAATTLLALARPSLLQLFAPRDSSDDLEPGIRSMGTGSFMRYTTLSLLLHHTALVLLVTFSLAEPQILLLKIVLSTLLTSLCIWAIEGFKR